MALLLSNIDKHTIRLISRWRSDEMLCYLHVTEPPLISGNAVNILTTGVYTLIPEATLTPTSVGTTGESWGTPRRVHSMEIYLG